jgi:hypothetical protein
MCGIKSVYWTVFIPPVKYPLCYFKSGQKTGTGDRNPYFQKPQRSFFFVGQTNMQDWIERSSVRGGPGEHLPYALALEIHTSLLPLITFATKLEMFRKVINNKDIPVSALAFYKATHANLICHLNAACAGDNLGNYSSPQSTSWVPFQKQKDQNKQKQQKTGGDSSPSGGARPSGNKNRSGCNGPNTATVGIINVPMHIRNGPSLSGDQKVCLSFVCKGDTCTLRRAYPNTHMTV